LDIGAQSGQGNREVAMSTTHHPTAPARGDLQWRAAVVEVEAAQQEYVRLLMSATVDDPAFDRAWLRLWRAERLRDTLLRLLD
jgi:hypothetical protein